MPVDEDNLELMLKTANTKLQETDALISELRKFISGCKDIKKISSDADPDVMQDIMDKKLGEKMTASRRMAEYNKLVVDSAILGL